MEKNSIRQKLAPDKKPNSNFSLVNKLLPIKNTQINL